MIKSFSIRVTLYILCLYDLYLYLPDLLGQVNIDVDLPTSDYMLYFDGAMLLFGGIILGVLLIKTGNKGVGWFIILMNVILTPLFIWKALP